MRQSILALVCLSAVSCKSTSSPGDASSSHADLGAELDAALLADASSATSDASSATSDASSTTSDASTTASDLGGADTSTATGGTCPGGGTPIGINACEYVPNVTLFDCDGNPVELHSLCSTELSYVYTYADWCPNCSRFASERANDLYANYRGTLSDFEMYFVITQTREYAAPDAAFCQQVRERYGLTMPVLYDRDGVTNSVLGMRVNTADMVLRRNGLIVINGPWAEFTVTTAIEGGYGECCTTCVVP